MTTPTGNGRPGTNPAFGDRLATAVAERESQIVLGIDPDPAKLWPEAIERASEARARLAITFSEAEEAAGESPPSPGAVARLEAAAAVLAHCRAVIDAAGPACGAGKPQMGCFGRLGAPRGAPPRHQCAPPPARGGAGVPHGQGGGGPGPPPAASGGCWSPPTESAGTSRSPPRPIPRRSSRAPRPPLGRSPACTPTPSPPIRCSAATPSSR